MLEPESSISTNQHFPEPGRAEPAEAADRLPAVDPFDPAAYFDRWLADVQADRASQHDHEGKEIYFESSRGSKCEVNFEGVLHFDGYTPGEH